MRPIAKLATRALFFPIFLMIVTLSISHQYAMAKSAENIKVDDGYTIDKYDIDIKVNENNKLDITETITAFFNESRHGIYRTIPLKNTITRLDGTTSTNRAQITNLEVDNEYTVSRENGNIKIKIGSPNYTVTGEQKYTIKYTYNLGKDPLPNLDELYYNIIGTEWDTSIDNVSFTITMPKNFDHSKLGFSSGAKGSTNNDDVYYYVNSNIITGRYLGTLNPGEGITVRCELPEGYFVGAGLDSEVADYIPSIVSVIFLLISILLWAIFGRDDKIIETVEYYPPKNLNSLDAGFLYKGAASNKDVTSLLIYLANKGYLEIIDKNINLSSDKVNIDGRAKEDANQKIIELQNKIIEEEKINPNSQKLKHYKNMLDIYQNIDTPIDYNQYNLGPVVSKFNTENDFVIKKIKDYDGTDIHEQWFMEGLFEYGRTEVTSRMLLNQFYLTNNRILGDINNKQNKERLFEKTASSKKIFIILMVAISYCLITIPPVLNYGQTNALFFTLLFPSIGFAVLFSAIFDSDPGPKIFKIVWGIGFGGGPWAIMVLPALMQDTLYLNNYIIGTLCIIGMAVCLAYLPKRTKYGTEILEKLSGFKNFLKTVEKDRLEPLVMDNPNYFYDILPFAYVFGISDKWIKKFESISLQAPSWYDSSDAFNISSFEAFMSSAMASAQGAMSSSPSSSSSSGGSSGGGSSGGGSGGGGGGSW